MGFIVNTWRYQASHGQKPSSGTSGQWWFAPKGCEEDMEEWWNHNGTYAAAVKALRAFGAKGQWVVLP